MWPQIGWGFVSCFLLHSQVFGGEHDHPPPPPEKGPEAITECDKDPASCWILQATEETQARRLKVNDPCEIKIVKVAELPPGSDKGREGTVQGNSSAPAPPAATEPPTTQAPVTSALAPSGTDAPPPDNSAGLGHHSGTMVVDPCMDEDNRDFMECVLKFGTDITEGHPDYNKGTCQCYKDWSIRAHRSPAYNHSLNPEVESQEWFTFNDTHKECVVQLGHRCAPADASVIPYRCAWSNAKEGTCAEIDEDPRYIICSWAIPPYLSLYEAHSSFRQLLILVPVLKLNSIVMLFGTSSFVSINPIHSNKKVETSIIASNFSLFTSRRQTRS